jgi:GDP-4-dehydro-6-deoxy-D-mannose reductase
MRVLITGITGFVGAYLAEHIVERHSEAAVWGLARWNSPTDNLRPIRPLIKMVTGDLTDASSLVRALQAARPDILFHLAASSTVASSWGTPGEILEVNTIGQVNLFEALRTLNLEPTIVVASSAEAYGRVEESELPIGEDQPFRPVSPYGVSKACQDLLALQYFHAYGLPTIRLRLFNHTGPRRPDRFVCSSFARQIAEIEKGHAAPRLEVGDLNVVRDFTDVRDVARAYWSAAIHGKPGAVYNVCSGTPASIRQILDRLLAESEHEVEVRVDPGRLRPADVPVLYGSRARFSEVTGWEPVIPLSTTLRDLLDWWRAAL